MDKDDKQIANTDDNLNWLEIFDHAPCGHLLTHFNGEIISINSTLLEMLDFNARSDFDKKKFQELLPIGGKIFYETQHITLAKLQETVVEVNYELIKKNGERINVLINSKIRRDILGVPLQFQHIIFPYSDRKKYESELINAKERAENLSEAKSDFLSTITHEIRTPLHAVIGISDILIQENPRPDQLEMLNILQVSSQNLLELVNSILEHNKVDAGKLVLEENPFDLDQMLNHLVKSLRPLAVSKNVEIELNISDYTPKYYIGDGVKINQILTNILGNSLKFTLEGKVEVKLDSRADLLGKRLLQFKIIDTGIGMTKAEIKSIFEPFTQANKSIHKKFGGTGIGLSVSQKLLQAYSSNLKVESKKGKGSIFEFNLRLKVCDQPLNLDRNSNTLNLENLSEIRLLVVDDSFSNHFIISTYLRKWEVAFHQANNGEEALNLVKENDYDVILMDLTMPDIDGYEVTKTIRSWSSEKFKHVPIIAYSAAISSQLSDEMKDAGLDDILLKPFRAEQLHRLLSKYTNSSISQPKNEPQKPDQKMKSVDASTFNPQIRQVRDLFEDDYDSSNKFLQAVINDLEVVKSKFMTLKTDQTANTKLFHDACHSVKTIIRMFELSRLSAIFIEGEKQLVVNDNLGFSKTLDEIINLLEKFSTWIQNHYNNSI